MFKTCEQFVYTNWEKAVGELPQGRTQNRGQLMYTAGHPQKPQTYPRFPQITSTRLYTGYYATLHLSNDRLSALSTVPIMTTTIYI